MMQSTRLFSQTHSRSTQTAILALPTFDAVVATLRRLEAALAGRLSSFEVMWQDFYERVGVAFELPNHFRKLTALENLAYFSSLYARATRPPQELLDMVGLGKDGTMPVAQFSKIGTARQVELKLGGKDFELSTEDVKALCAMSLYISQPHEETR